MKITVESAKGLIGMGINSSMHDIYLNGEIKGWLGMFGKVEMDNIIAGKNTITIKSYEVHEMQKRRSRSIQFTATQDVHIWIRENTASGKNRFSVLTLGEDVKILEETNEEKES